MTRKLALALVLGGALTTVARADHNDHSDDATTSEEQVVLVNAAPKLGDNGQGQITRLRRALDSRNMLRKLPDGVEAALDGRNVAVGDLDQIRDAYQGADYATALKLIEADEQRVLDNVGGGDPVPALAELSEWRGLIAAGLNQKDEAVKNFRVALRFNPAWNVEKRYASSTVRALVKKARREVEATGSLKVDADPDTAMMVIDGGEPKPASGKLTLTAGKHLVVINAPDRKPYAELVDIEVDQTERLTIALDKETKEDRAARLVDETVAAPPGKARLKKTKALSKQLGGVKRVLFVEDGGEDRVIVRLYDTQRLKVSRPVELEGGASSAAIARKVQAALDPDAMIDASAVPRFGGHERSSHWYEKWYVWAAIGGVVAVGGFAGYEYASRAPTSVRGF